MAFSCHMCQDEGFVFNKSGVKLTCSCKLKKEIGITTDNKDRAPVYKIDALTVESCLHKKLVPEFRINDTFNIEHIKDNIIRMYNKSPFVLYGFDRYIGLLSKISLTISTNGRLPTSYIIGAPNGFGKTSFVNSCIMLMDKQDMKCVPYISLLEIATLRHREQKQLIGARYFDSADLATLRLNEEEVPGSCAQPFSFTDYVNANVLFTYMSSIDCAEIESKMLKDLILMRDTKGLPTVVFIPYTLQIYTRTERLKTYVWDEILAYKKDYVGYDRLTHESTHIKGTPAAPDIIAQLKAQSNWSGGHTNAKE